MIWRSRRLAYEVAAVALGPLSVPVTEKFLDGPFLLFAVVLVPGLLVVPVLGRAYIRPYLWPAAYVAIGFALFQVATYSHPATPVWQVINFFGWFAVFCLLLSPPIVLLGVRAGVVFLWRRRSG